MYKHLIANLWLLVSTLFLCCGLYFLVLWVVGQTFFRDQAAGSLLVGPDGKPVGSRLIAQPFSQDEYFHPRPSAVGYNASASGASNWGPSHYLLRDRVARQLGPIVRYRKGSVPGRSVQQDIANWFQARPGVVAEWAGRYPSVARGWVGADDHHKAAVLKWQNDHPEAVSQWKQSNPEAGEPEPADLAEPFFRSNAEAFRQSWPRLIDDPSWSVPAVFFDMWLQEHKGTDLQQVPADLVMASGSGLDPHITLKNARYQLDRVAAAWATKKRVDPAVVAREIEKLLDEKHEAPLGGWVGVPLVNVLEVNLALSDRMDRLARSARNRPPE